MVGFGTALATQNQSTPSADLPVVLAGTTVSVQDAAGVLRLAPGNGARLHLRQRRVAVPVGELILAEPARLQRIVAVRQPRIRLAHGRHQRIHHLRLDPEHFWSRFQLGRCYLSLGRVPEAVETLGACVALRS